MPDRAHSILCGTFPVRSALTNREVKVYDLDNHYMARVACCDGVAMGVLELGLARAAGARSASYERSALAAHVLPEQCYEPLDRACVPRPVLGCFGHGGNVVACVSVGTIGRSAGAQAPLPAMEWRS